MKNPKTFLFSLILSSLSVTNVFSQINTEVETKLTSEKQKTIIQNFSDSLTKHYFFQDSAKMIAEKLNFEYNNGAFSEIKDDSLFAVSVTKFVRTIVSDNHLGLKYRKNFQPPMPSRPRENNPPENQEPAPNSPVPIEFKILENNIGYLKIDMFDEQPSFYEKIGEAFQILKSSNALIIDLSKCRGGSPRANNFLISHLLPPKTQLTSIFNLRNGEPFEFKVFTFDSLKSERYIDKPVFLITGEMTFSSGESFCYDLQVLKRATVVGVNTKGGANPGREFKVGDFYVAFIPTGRSFNHITKSNWEGVGIIPDILVNEEEALVKAIFLANEKN